MPTDESSPLPHTSFLIASLKFVVNRRLFEALFSCALLLIATLSSAQTIEQSASYVSRSDQDLTIRRVSVLPVIDNVDGIFARPIESELIELVKSSHRWDYTEANLAGSLPGVETLEEDPTEFQKLIRSIEADAFIVAAASKGPSGLSLRLNLFLKVDGKLLAQEVARDVPRFEIPALRALVQSLYKGLLAKLPYQGILLSRQGNRVTLNIGSTDGLVVNQVINVVQIINVIRHPRFNFLLSTEKEILGRVKVLKVDDTLSFGAIISEKERGAIGNLAKITFREPVTYPEPGSINEESSGLSSRPDAKVFGNEPKEWLPVRVPSFGQLGLGVGLGSFNGNVNLDSPGNLEAKTSVYPSLSLHGELWLNPRLTVRAELTQGVLSTSNPRSGSTPETLNFSQSRYALMLGYNFLLRDDFFGPKFQFITGFSTYRLFVDDSQPQALTTTTFSGMMLGLGGSFPVTDEKLWYVGGRLNVFLMPRLSESPANSGANPSVTINHFSFSAERRIAQNMRLYGSLDFELYGATFSGPGTRTGPSGAETATSLSQRHTSFTGGLLYMF